MKAATVAPKHEMSAKHDARDATHKASEKKPASSHAAGREPHESEAFATHLLHALKPSAATHPSVPLPHLAAAVPPPSSSSSSVVSASTHAKRAQAHKVAGHADEPATARSASDRPSPVLEAAAHAPSKETSSQPGSTFSAELARDVPRASDVPVPPAPPPAWMPPDAVGDESARMAVFPHSLNWTSDIGSLHLQIRGSEVTLRAHGELAVSLRNSDSELRVALAQKGLELHDSDATRADTDDRQQQSQSQHEQRQEHDEWT